MNRLSLNYRIIGKNHLPHIVFLHGFMGNSAEWRPTAAALSDSFRCVLIDLPGHGKSLNFSNPSAYSMEGSSDLIVNLLNDLGIKESYLAGYSMGGRIALNLALSFPEKFKKAVIESGSPGLKTQKEKELRRKYEQSLIEKLESIEFSEFLKYWYEQPLFSSLLSNINFNKLLLNRQKNDSGELVKSIKFLGTSVQPSLWKNLNQNKIPLLLLVGEKDIKFRKIAQEMKQFSQSINIEIVAGAGHNIHFEKPEIFQKKLLNFLQ